MAKRNEVYKCKKCGNIVEVLVGGPGKLNCCGMEMGLLVENSTDAAVEKHVPVIEKVDGGYRVTVGSTAHPMSEDHYIVWIELLKDNKIYRKYLNPDNTPEAVFHVCSGEVSVRAYCNIHGHWKS